MDLFSAKTAAIKATATKVAATKVAATKAAATKAAATKAAATKTATAKTATAKATATKATTAKSMVSNIVYNSYYDTTIEPSNDLVRVIHPTDIPDMPRIIIRPVTTLPSSNIPPELTGQPINITYRY